VSRLSPEDLKRYRSLVEAVELDDSIKDEMIVIIWSMMRNFVDRAFGIAPEQLSQLNNDSKTGNRTVPHASVDFILASDSTCDTVITPATGSEAVSDEERDHEPDDARPESRHLLPR
jgi:hypothetical protein